MEPWYAKFFFSIAMEDIQEIGSAHLNVMTVIFNGFNLPNIGINLLGTNKHPNLKKLDLSNNNIET